MSKRIHFARMASAAEKPIERAPQRIAILTGQSMLTRSPLSPRQAAFLDAVAPPGWVKVGGGFPFDADGPPDAPAPFAQAAVSSIRQYLWASGRRGYDQLAAGALNRLLFATAEHLVLLAGSSGLAIFNAAEPHLETGEARVSVIGLGPAGRIPARPHGFFAIRARKDRWSQLLGPRADALVDGDHYCYWHSDDVRSLVAEQLARSCA